MSGSQCGTYLIQPQQMNCDWPSNVDDNAITPNGNYAQPLSTLTELTYFVLRIRFSIIFRSIVDAAWEAGSDLDDLPYDIVLECDKRLNDLLGELENSFRAIEKTSQKASDRIQEPNTSFPFSLDNATWDYSVYTLVYRAFTEHISFEALKIHDMHTAAWYVCVLRAQSLKLGSRWLNPNVRFHTWYRLRYGL
jgi:hypothetical protein